MESTETQRIKQSNTWIAYVAPMIVFMVLTQLEGQFRGSYPLVYTLKAIAVAITLVVCRASWRDLKWDAKSVGLGLAVGIVGLALWVAMEKYIPYPRMGARTAYNPLKEISNPTQAWAFISIRFVGLALLVPVMEELFWRSFLIRWLTRPEWESIRPHEFSLQGCALVAAGFALAHPEWLSAVVFALLMAWLLRYTRSVMACVVAHAATNFGLGVYVLVSGDWKLW